MQSIMQMIIQRQAFTFQAGVQGSRLCSNFTCAVYVTFALEVDDM